MDFFLQAADIMGAPHSVAAIYASLFASPKALCFADLEARLDLSKGSISQGLRFLREIGAIKTVQTTNARERREFFAPDTELRKVVQRYLNDRLQKQIDQGTQSLKTLSGVIPNLETESQDILKERVGQLESWHTRARSLVPVMNTFLVLAP
jgi:DNA-binding transcriptional regulator GbsR (MarR family)